MNKKEVFPIENSNGILASLQLCTTTIQSAKGWTHHRNRICLMMEFLHVDGSGSQGLPMMLDLDQTNGLITQLRQMAKAMKKAGDSQSVQELEPVF